ncbi:MAG: hypothetical protein JWM49_2530 [Microbacteriaceae bacterium]|nr:hypothetical protein [Microbacteriaceae bacterium]
MIRLVSGAQPAESALSVLPELQNRDKHASLRVVTDHVIHQAGSSWWATAEFRSITRY